jgi:hypothetical protein
MKNQLSIRSPVFIGLATLAMAGCSGADRPNAAPVAKPKSTTRLPTEADMIGVWKGARTVNPQGEFLIPAVIDQFRTETIEFKPDHTEVSHETVSDPKGNWSLDSSGTWSLDGSTVVYTLPAVMKLPPIVTPLKWQNGTLTEMRGTVQFIFERQPDKPGTK